MQTNDNEQLTSLDHEFIGYFFLDGTQVRYIENIEWNGDVKPPRFQAVAWKIKKTDGKAYSRCPFGLDDTQPLVDDEVETFNGRTELAEMRYMINEYRRAFPNKPFKYVPPDEGGSAGDGESGAAAAANEAAASVVGASDDRRKRAPRRPARDWT